MDVEKKGLPLREAYLFGSEHELEQEMTEIKDMEIEWDLSYTSSLRRGYVVNLFRQKQLFDAFIEQHWPVGKTNWGQKRCESLLRLKVRYEDFLAGRGEGSNDDDDEEESQAFAAEADLRDYLANNLDRVEAGLKLYRDGERSGVEFPLVDGRIDILTIDKAGRFVVFELKLARGRNRVLGQLLYYMSWVDKHLGNGPCRGFIVAKEITEDLALATHRVQGVSLYRYELDVSVKLVA